MQHPKHSFLSSLLPLINRPMLALSVLIHIALLSIPLPETTPESPEEISGITDFSQVNLATSPIQSSPIESSQPLPVPPSPPQGAKVDPKVGGPLLKVDLSRAPRPPKKVSPIASTPTTPAITPTPAKTAETSPKTRSTPTPAAPRPAPKAPTTPQTPQSSQTPSPTPQPQSSPIPVPSPPPVSTPPPPPALEGAELQEGLTVEGVQSLLTQFRGTRSGTGNGEVYPAELAQPNAFFKPQVLDSAVATENDCLPLMIDCWWERDENPTIVKQSLEQEELFQNIAFEEVAGGYGGGQLYRLLQKSTGAPTPWYLTLVKPKGVMTKGTMVGFWHTDPRFFSSL